MDTGLLFREYRNIDLDEVCEFCVSDKELLYVLPSEKFPLTKSRLETILYDRNLVFVVQTSVEKTIGLASLYNLTFGKKAFIGSVMISMPHRRGGIGRNLIEHLIDKSVEFYQLEEIHVLCFSENIEGLRFYENIGFVPYKVKYKKCRDGKVHSLICMKRLLYRENSFGGLIE